MSNDFHFLPENWDRAVFLHEQHLLIFYVNWKTWTNVEIFTEGKLYAFSPNNFINNNNISQNTKYCWTFLILCGGIRVCPFSFDDQSHAVRWRRLIRRGRTGTGVETVLNGSWSWEAAEVLLLILELWWVSKGLVIKVITARTVAENESVVAEFYFEVFFPEKRHPEYDQDQD